MLAILSTTNLKSGIVMTDKIPSEFLTVGTLLKIGIFIFQIDDVDSDQVSLQHVIAPKKSSQHVFEGPVQMSIYQHLISEKEIHIATEADIQAAQRERLRCMVTGKSK